MIGIKLIFLMIILNEMMRSERFLLGSIIRIQKRFEHHITIKQMYFQSTINKELSILRLHERYLQMISMRLTTLYSPHLLITSSTEPAQSTNTVKDSKQT